MYKKKILIVTERRADFSRFKPIMSLIKKDKKLKYILVATGSHLLRKHGYTINEIIKNKFKVSYKIKNFQENSNLDDGANMIDGIAKVLLSISKLIKKIKPDIILSGFDIGANFAVTIAGAHLNVPVVHIQGGEVTGSIDESIRHSMSKFSNYHLVANVDAKKRLIKMGEKPNSIFVVGCPSLDALFLEKKISNKKMKEKFNINLNKKFVIIIQHPVTTENASSKSQIKETIKAIKKLKIQSLFILPNNDSGHKSIILEIKKNKLNWTETLSIGEYKTLLSKASVLIGNSSSGIHESASFKLPVVNIGSRQNGRLKPKNVVNVSHNYSEIYKKINFCLKNKKFKYKLKSLINPYGDGKSALKIISIIKKIDLSLSTQKQNTY